MSRKDKLKEDCGFYKSLFFAFFAAFCAIIGYLMHNKLSLMLLDFSLCAIGLLSCASGLIFALVKYTKATKQLEKEL